MNYGPLPSIPGVTFEATKGVFQMTFRYTKPLPIVQTNTQAHWARLHWKIKDSFRWLDFALANYKTGVWDVSPLLANSETVKLYGVSGFHVTSSVD